MYSNKIKTLVLALGFGLISSGMVYAAPASAPQQTAKSKSYNHKETSQMSMTVKSVDLKNRILSLSDESGDEFILHAGPSVNNLSQLHAGDKLAMQIVTSFAADLVDSNDNTSTTTKDRQSSPEGTLPKYSYKTEIDTTVKVLKISAKHNLVTVRTAKGEVRKIHVKKPELQNRLKAVKVGDNVSVKLIMLVKITALPAEVAKAK